MARNKITIVGAGNVGATTAHIAATGQLGDIVLIDIIKGLPEGKALDIAEAAPVQLYDSNIVGTCDWEETAGSDIVIITSGLPRKPGMSRDDLLAKNAGIVKDVSEKTAKYSPDSIVIIVCNPLDAMVYTAGKVTGFAKNKVMGMAGALDSARFSCFLAANRRTDRTNAKRRHRSSEPARLQRLLRPRRRSGKDGRSNTKRQEKRTFMLRLL